ncbi:hypothetical protein ZTR_00941 [Talaromyces verruculosus]|nr:hypothetical protein ZTR_00941 [Talaromyces verruculosus]
MLVDIMPKLAVLIDADNAQPSICSRLLSEISKYGTAHVKRAYGDWTTPNLKGWKEQLLEQSIHPIQQFAYTHGKNATDSALIIDAMDLLYSGRFEGFCIVSSDSDFTRLAARIRESGVCVYGFGERKTPKPFVAACDKFVYTENLVHLEDLVPHTNRVVVPGNSSPALQTRIDDHLSNQLRTAVEMASDDDGWARLSSVGTILTKQYPDFDPRTFGCHKLSDIVTSSSIFEIARRSHREGLTTDIYVRDKRRQHEGSAIHSAGPKETVSE